MEIHFKGSFLLIVCLLGSTIGFILRENEIKNKSSTGQLDEQPPVTSDDIKHLESLNKTEPAITIENKEDENNTKKNPKEEINFMSSTIIPITTTTATTATLVTIQSNHEVKTDLFNRNLNEEIRKLNHPIENHSNIEIHELKPDGTLEIFEDILEPEVRKILAEDLQTDLHLENLGRNHNNNVDELLVEPVVEVVMPSLTTTEKLPKEEKMVEVLIPLTTEKSINLEKIMENTTTEIPKIKIEINTEIISKNDELENPTIVETIPALNNSVKITATQTEEEIKDSSNVDSRQGKGLEIKALELENSSGFPYEFPNYNKNHFKILSAKQEGLSNRAHHILDLEKGRTGKAFNDDEFLSNSDNLIDSDATKKNIEGNIILTATPSLVLNDLEQNFLEENIKENLLENIVLEGKIKENNVNETLVSSNNETLKEIDDEKHSDELPIILDEQKTSILDELPIILDEQKTLISSNETTFKEIDDGKHSDESLIILHVNKTFKEIDDGKHSDENPIILDEKNISLQLQNLNESQNLENLNIKSEELVDHEQIEIKLESNKDEKADLVINQDELKTIEDEKQEEKLRLDHIEQKLIEKITNAATEQRLNEINETIKTIEHKLIDETLFSTISTTILPDVIEKTETNATTEIIDDFERIEKDITENEIDAKINLIKTLNENISDYENSAIETITSEQSQHFNGNVDDFETPVPFSESSTNIVTTESTLNLNSENHSELTTTQSNDDDQVTISSQENHIIGSTTEINEKLVNKSIEKNDKSSNSSSSSDSSEESSSSESSEEKIKKKKHKQKKIKQKKIKMEKKESNEDDSDEKESSENYLSSKIKANGRSLDLPSVSSIQDLEKAVDPNSNGTAYIDEHSVIKKPGVKINEIFIDTAEINNVEEIPNQSKKIFITTEKNGNIPPLTFQTSTVLPLKIFKDERSLVTENVIEILENETVTTVLAETLFEAAELTTELNRQISSFRTNMETDIEIPNEINETVTFSSIDVMASSNIGKALPNYDLRTDNASSNTSIVLLIVTTTIILIIGVLALTFFRFRGKHGTLDIQMEEQRHGKDCNNDDDDDDDIDSNCNESTSVTQSLQSSHANDETTVTPPNEISLLSSQSNNNAVAD